MKVPRSNRRHLTRVQANRHRHEPRSTNRRSCGGNERAEWDVATVGKLSRAFAKMPAGAQGPTSARTKPFAISMATVPRPLKQFTNPLFPRNLEPLAAASAAGAMAGGGKRLPRPRSPSTSRNCGKAQSGTRCVRAARGTCRRLFVFRHWPEIREQAAAPAIVFVFRHPATLNPEGGRANARCYA
jgi:hypothetical protein